FPPLVDDTGTIHVQVSDINDVNVITSGVMGQIPESNNPNSSPSLSWSTLYAKLVTEEPNRNVSPTPRKSMNFRTLITPAGNEAEVVVPLESIRAIS
ncbi:hypothetical protein Tco_1362297, partial [Tanacetum coccineum]